MNWKYRGTEITLNDEGIFHANVDGALLEAPSVAAIKTKIARCQDSRRKFDVTCWVAEVENLDSRDEPMKIRSGLAKYTGFDLVGGTAKLTFCDEAADKVRTDSWDVTLWAFPPLLESLEKPLALRRLEEAVEKYNLEREIFRERLEKIQAFRLPGHVSREHGVAIEAQIAERLGGQHVSIEFHRDRGAQVA